MGSLRLDIEIKVLRPVVLFFLRFRLVHSVHISFKVYSISDER